MEIPLVEMWPLNNAKFPFLYLIFVFTIDAAIIKGAILFKAGRHSVEPWRASSPLRKVSRAYWFFSYLCPNKRFLHHKYANKRFYKEFVLQRSFVVIL